MMVETIRRIIFGRPIPTRSENTALLSKTLALPIFCSDAISSVAYGGQQILLTLCLAGLWLPAEQAHFNQATMVITGLIVALLAIVAMSYWQTVFAYPGGGGSYIVTKDNLGTKVGLVAAAALLIDYVLCVSVSTASGMQNLKDIPLLQPLHIGENLVAYCLAGITFMTLLNLRGLKEPGILFAAPVYTFVAMCYVMIVIGLFGDHFGWQFHQEYANQVMPQMRSGNHGLVATLSLAVLLRAFASGCSALTGVEAVSNGVPAFAEPKCKNAAVTLIWMAMILGTIFLGVSLLAVKFHIVYWEANGLSAAAVIDQLSGTVFGKNGPSSWAYLLTQFSTALILLIAAQTSFADFPRVTSILAGDGFMPRQLAHLGDRLAFDNGVMILGVISSLFIILKKGSVDQLIPFFTVGVFLAFSLSQSGMVKHWFVCKEKSWRRKALINGIGAVATSIVLIDILAEKFLDGAWFVVLLIFLLLFLFHRTAAHYKDVSRQLTLDRHALPPPIKNRVLVLVQGMHVGTYKALLYARSISSDCLAVSVEIEPDWTSALQKEWQQYAPDVPLVIVKSPYRSLIGPLMQYLDALHAGDPESVTTIVLGEFVSTRWWHKILHGNTGLILKFAFLSRQDVVVTNVRYWLSQSTL